MRRARVGDRHVPPRPPGNRPAGTGLGSEERHPGKCCSFKITPLDRNPLGPKRGQQTLNENNNAKVAWGAVFTHRKGGATP